MEDFVHISHSLQARPSAASPASTVEDAPARSPYLLRDFVKVEELEMLYAEFCLGTRATEEPSVTWGQRWCEQPVTPERHRRSSPTAGRKQPRRDEATLHPPRGRPSPAKETYISTLQQIRGRGQNRNTAETLT